MTRSGTWLTAALAALPALGMSALMAAAGCSDDELAPAAPDAGSFCPATVALAQGSACNEERQVCTIGYACPFLTETARCTCTGGTFACVNARGAPVTGGTPACTSGGTGSDGACPESEPAADGVSCKVAGLQCNYASAACRTDAGADASVSVSPALFVDVCHCTGRTLPDGGNRLAFKCESNRCPTTVDASVPDATADATADAGPLDAGPLDAGPLDAGEGG